jgi:hypothetical protein
MMDDIQDLPEWLEIDLSHAHRGTCCGEQGRTLGAGIK